MTINIKILAVVCLLVGLVLGYVGGTMAGNKSVADLKARVAGSTATLPQMAEVRQLSGVVKSISGNNVTFAVQPRDPLGDPSLDERSVTINDKTKVTIMTQKDPAVFQKEMDEFQSAMQKVKPGASPTAVGSTSDSSVVPTPPQFFDKKTGNASSLKVGQTINVTSEANIKDQKSFTAVTIEILPISAAPAVAPPTNTTGPGAAATVPPPSPVPPR
ncbi:MAG: hypothetical protein Q8P17_01780 [bacterium]|nr:hypothetical protein [bacterium]